VPIYPHRCPHCATEFDVAKSYKLLDREEPCPQCATPAERLIALVNIDKMAAGDWNTQTWNPGLGCYTKSNREAEKIAKSRGLECVGNEKPETIHKHFDQAREDRRKARWAEADRVKLYSDD
jgi:putative FmdB family regulatory protein